MLKIVKNDSIEVIDQGDSLREVEEKKVVKTPHTKREKNRKSMIFYFIICIAISAKLVKLSKILTNKNEVCKWAIFKA